MTARELQLGRPRRLGGLPATLRSSRLHRGEVHGLHALADIEQVNDTDPQRLREVEHHAETRVADTAFQLLEVAVVDARRGSGLLLRPALDPAGFPHVPADPLEHRLEVHARRVATHVTRKEPTGSSCFSLTRAFLDAVASGCGQCGPVLIDRETLG